jgi:hypothetical protein
MVKTAVRVPQRDLDLMYLAAERAGISQSEFLRRAIVETAARMLTPETPTK